MLPLPPDPSIDLVENDTGEVTLSIAGGQAMQAWERDLMHESADLLCSYGSDFLEAGLGLGLSALRIAGNSGTRHHRVIERYPGVIDLFRSSHPQVPESLEIIRSDWFEFIKTVPRESVDGIFFAGVSLERWPILGSSRAADAPCSANWRCFNTVLYNSALPPLAVLALFQPNHRRAPCISGICDNTLYRENGRRRVHSMLCEIVKPPLSPRIRTLPNG